MANHTILLIDYEPKSIDKVRRPLSGCGYVVEVATDGVAGLEAFHRLKPDLVMIEAMIPKKHGFEVCQEIKKTPQGKRTPIIITTSVYKGRKYRNQAFHIHGCDEYLEKPLDEDQIVSVCRRMLGDTGEVIPRPLPASDDSAPMADHAPEPPIIAPPPTMVLAPAPTLDDDELEILARLDAILPGSMSGGGESKSMQTAPPPASAPMAPAPPAPAPSVEAPSSSSRQASMSAVASAVEEPHKDLFATSFLSSGASSDLANETVREAEDTAEPALVIEDETEAADDAQVVPFESKRSRRKERKSKKGAAAQVQPFDGTHVPAVAAAAAAEVHDEPLPQEAAAVAHSAPVETTFTVSSQKPTSVDLDAMLLESDAPSRPWWISVALAVVLLGAAGFLMYVYLGGLFGGAPR